MSITTIHQPIARIALTPPPHAPALTLDTSRPGSTPIPNKHLPFCPPGPAPRASEQIPATPPASPPSKHTGLQTFSLLHPADTYAEEIASPPVYSIDAFTLTAAINEIASQSFPDPQCAFPWLHGLHPENQVQLSFFNSRRKCLRNTPKCFRGITIVKAGGDLSRSRLKGAVSPEEVLDLGNSNDATFLEVDPREGFSVRNFQIQATKLAMVSDIVVYADDEYDDDDSVHDLATKFAIAQSTCRSRSSYCDEDAPIFNTFIVSSRLTISPKPSSVLTMLQVAFKTSKGIIPPW